MQVAALWGQTLPEGRSRSGPNTGQARSEDNELRFTSRFPGGSVRTPAGVSTEDADTGRLGGRHETDIAGFQEKREGAHEADTDDPKV